MRTCFFFAPLVLLLACGGKGEAPDQGSGKGGQVASGGDGASTGGTGGDGASTGGTGGDGGSTTSGGTVSTGGTAGQGMAGPGLVDCDLRSVECRIAQPICADNQVPSVNGSCFGPCVPIESCACSTADECPFSDRYTCWQRTHCGPYVR